MREFDLLIDGKPQAAASHATYVTTNPATGEPVSLVPRSSAREARRAIEAARRAADSGSWHGALPSHRSRVLGEVAGELWERQTEAADLDTAEAGIPIKTSSALAAAAIEGFRAAAERAGAMLPHGVVAVVAPGDAPFARALEMLGPVLAAGNAAVVACAPDAPGTTLDLARAFAESDVPPGVVNVVGGLSPDALRELASNPLVDHVLYEGPLDGARRVAEEAAPSLRTHSLEPSEATSAVLLDGADLDGAVPGTAWGAFFLSGRMSRRVARVFVPATDLEPLTHHLVRGATAIRLGDPASFETDAGPMASPAVAADAARMIDRAVAAGAKLACGGAPVQGMPSAAFFPPTVVTTTLGSRLLLEETAAPVLAVAGYRDASEALRAAAAAPAGVVLWAGDGDEAAALGRGLRVRRAWVNRPPSPLGERLWSDGFGRPARVYAGARDARWLGLLGMDRAFGV